MKQNLGTNKLISRRLADEWKLLASVFIGILIAVTIGAGSTMYLNALSQLAFKVSLERLGAPTIDLDVFAKRIALKESAIDRADELLSTITTKHLGDLYVGHETYVRGEMSIVGTQQRPLPEIGDQESNATVSSGFLHWLTNLETRASVTEGRMFTAETRGTQNDPVVEAVISVDVAQDFRFEVGDTVTLAPDVFVPIRISAEIVGFIEPDDLETDYWSTAGILLRPGSAGTRTPSLEVAEEGADPPPPPAPDGVQWDTNEEMAVGLFVHRSVIFDVLSPAYPGSITNPILFAALDTNKLGDWSADRFVEKLTDTEEELREVLPGASVISGTVKGLIANVARRVFFSRIPLLLLMTVMVVTVLFYMTMMTSYLARSRERDSALLRTRGVKISELFRLYGAEGLVMVVIAVLLGPLLAYGFVSVLGWVPPFREITGGDVLLVKLEAWPLVVAGSIGIVSLAAYVGFSIMGIRHGLLVQKLLAARPIQISFFHRYYLDLALILIGAATFWELQSRDQITAGGSLDTQVSVNETLLLAPVLFLFVVALLFMRLFPLFVRFISGESPALAHLLAGSSIVVLTSGLFYDAQRLANVHEALVPIALLLTFGGTYWVSHRLRSRWAMFWPGVALQSALIAGFIYLRSPDSSDLLFFPTIAVSLSVLAGALFSGFVLMTRAAPAWLSVSLWHMGRNPLQYTWLVLLLVLVTGLGVFATTVGGTLTRSQTDRVLYEVASDMRVIGQPIFFATTLLDMKEKIVNSPGFDEASLALRTSGTVGASNAQILAVQPREFSEISWFRDDFADRSLKEVLTELDSMKNSSMPITLPDDATDIGTWIRPLEEHPLISMWVVLEDRRGLRRTVSLGGIGETEWHQLSTQLPPNLDKPINLVAIAFYEPGVSGVPGRGGSAKGTILLDNLYTVSNGNERVIEGFETVNDWKPIPTSQLGSDLFYTSDEGVLFGEKAGVFSFGQYKNRSVRGVYLSDADGVIPVVISRNLATAEGLGVGAVILTNVAGWLVPMKVQDIINRFPTFDDKGGTFIVADFESLVDYMNIMSQLQSVEANELFARKTGDAPESVLAIKGEINDIMLSVRDGSFLLETIRLDPLTNSGWRALVFLAVGVVLLAAGFGYTAYLLLVGEKNRYELGFLQSMGLSKRQLLWLMSFEHLTVVILGLGLGTWAGFQMSRLMVSPLAVDELGESVIPPFVLVTDWGVMVAVYCVIGLICVSVLAVVGRSIGRTKLFELARGAEE